MLLGVSRGGTRNTDCIGSRFDRSLRLDLSSPLSHVKNPVLLTSISGPSKDPNVLSAMIPLPAGTHHLTFLVDGNMRIAGHLPTAVDYTNVLINYVEVSVDDLPAPSGPLDIPHPYQPGRQAIDQQTVPAGYHRPQTLPPPSPDLKPTAPSTAPSAGPSGISAQTPQQESATSSQTQLMQGHPPQKRFFSDKQYHREIPRFLQDLDAPEESSRFARANAVMGTQPAPPSLPMFLNKSILNGQMPMKDDASVLIMPNHTVLNHLATTSIKNHVLATSATTRYKRKVSDKYMPLSVSHRLLTSL